MFLVLSMLVNVAVGQPKPPTCTQALKGILWNFGSDEVPTLKRCDGEAYVPWSAKTSANDKSNSMANPGTLTAKVDFKADKKTCEAACDQHGRDCSSKRCEMEIDGAGCRKKCMDIRLSCKSHCGEVKP
jgi:hypothetical protein